MWGEYCCETELEATANHNFAACDGGPISINSVCCEDNKYEKCPHIGGCINNRGINCCQKRAFIKYIVTLIKLIVCIQSTLNILWF